MAQLVDARGLACPKPVILTRNALQEAPPGPSVRVTAIVDNATARENVRRMAEKSGATVRVEERDDGIYVHILQGETPLPEPARTPASEPAAGPTVVVIPSEYMGRGDDELGHILMRAFFHTLGEVGPRPDTIVLLNSGVKLVIHDSPVLEDLQALVNSGVEILACGTCLGHYELTRRTAVGEISNMYTIAETILGAAKVINL